MGRLTRLSEEDHRSASLLIGLVVIIRVIAVMAVWLVLFMGVFVGYFTLPILLVTVITILYSVTDIGLFFTVRRREQTRKDRQDFRRKQVKDSEIDTTERFSNE